MSEYKKRISKIRKIMTKKGINAFLVTHEDEHLLENTPQNYERLSWISGFTGSAGYMIITLTNLFLFVDGRYTLQAKIQTKILNIKIYNISELDFQKFILSKTHKIKNIAIDIRTISQSLYLKYFKILKMQKLKVINIKTNLIDMIWHRDLKTQNTNNIFILEKKYCGISSSEKIKKILSFLKFKS